MATSTTDHIAANLAAPITPAVADRVRWGPIIAGLFAALSTLAVLGVLGAAIGFSAYDVGDNSRNFGIGAGIWGAVSALIAFAVGGWLAARSASIKGEGNGVLNGAMVWVVAVPVLTYALVGATGAVVRPAVNAGATAAANTAANVASNDPNAPSTENLADRAQQASDRLTRQVTGNDIQRGANTAARASWITLISLLLSLAAAAFGGYVGSTNPRRDVTTIR